MYNIGRKGTASGCVICCKIHFSCSVSIRQIKFAFRRFMGRRHQPRSGRSGLLLGESGEHLFHRTSVNPDSLPQMLGALCSKACGVQGAWVDSTRYRILQPGSNVGVKLPTSLSFIRGLAKDRIVLHAACLQVPLHSPLLERSLGDLTHGKAILFCKRNCWTGYKTIKWGLSQERLS